MTRAQQLDIATQEGPMAQSNDGHPAQRGPRSGGAERRLSTRPARESASKGESFISLVNDLDADSDIECRFEVFRADEQAMTSTKFSGGDWRGRLVTTDGLILAEASGYPSEGTCRAAIAVLQRRAATAAVVGAAEFP
jgi:uncharacterized protein YegP (UPF0339 family)